MARSLIAPFTLIVILSLVSRLESKSKSSSSISSPSPSSKIEVGPTYVPSGKSMKLISRKRSGKSMKLKSSSNMKNVKGFGPKSYLPRDESRSVGRDGMRSLSCDIGSNRGTEYRLPSNVIPEHYDLLLDLDLNQLTYTGTESITLNFFRTNIPKWKDSITLHSLQLNLTRVQLFLSNDPTIAIMRESSFPSLRDLFLSFVTIDSANIF